MFDSEKTALIGKIFNLKLLCWCFDPKHASFVYKSYRKGGRHFFTMLLKFKLSFLMNISQKIVSF